MKRELINKQVIIHLIGNLIIIIGGLMLFAIPFSIYYNEGDLTSIFISSFCTLSCGLSIRYITKESKNDEIRTREAYLIVTLGWVFMTAFSSLPYIISSAIPNYSDAFFETISGLTTTGASVLNNIESIPKGILFWRSMTQWIGGMGIIVLTIAVLPLLGVGGMELFASEAPGPTKDKIHPRIKETAKRLWLIYFTLTILQTILLWLSGMSFYDSINHALTTMSTGGFSTKQDSIGHFGSPLIQYIIILFMFIAGTNFTLLYFGFKGKISKFKQNDEFKWYVFAILILVIAIIFPVYIYNYDSSIEKTFRDSLFQVVSIITTTGYATSDYTHWGNYTTFIFFLLLFTGASAGSTSGGMKIVRIVILMKNGFLEFKKKLHPKAVLYVTMNKQSVQPSVIYNLMAFFFFILFVFVIGSIIMTLMGVDFLTSISAVATSVGNVGPGINTISPSNTFKHLPDASKWLLSFLMLMGRLELFTVAIIFSPHFWKRI